LIQDNGTSISANVAPSALYTFYLYKQQLTATGDGQHTFFGYRTRDSQNDGTAYSVGSSNSGTAGYSFWGDLYSFGVAGYNYNDYSRCGGTLGAEQSGTYWGSLGYRNSGLVNYGVYGSAAYASGGGFLPTNAIGGVGGGFFGDFIGSISRGSVIGQLNAGELFAAYNIGDVYTSGKQVELVKTGETKTAAYSTSSTSPSVLSRGKLQLVNGQATFAFDSKFAAMLGESPIVTLTPMGACNGVYIASISKEGFTVKELNGGRSTVELSWIAIADRVDAATTTLPEVMKEQTLDQNLLDVMYNDGNKEGAGKGMWWDGKGVRFGKMPSELGPKPKSANAK
jgi:hypothetical protein